MKKYLYLRIMATVNLLVAATCLVLIFAAVFKNFEINRLHWILAMVLPFVSVFAHSIIILYVYSRHYPDKDLPRYLLVYYRVAEIISWLGAVVPILGFIVLISTSYENGFDEGFRIMSIGLIMAVSVVIQLVTGGKFLETIRNNARLTLENSFN